MSREWEDKPQNWEKISIFNTSGLPGGSDGKESSCNAGDLGLIPRLGRFPGKGHGKLL